MDKETTDIFFKKFYHSRFLLLLIVIVEHTCMTTIEMNQEKKKWILNKGHRAVFRPCPN